MDTLPVELVMVRLSGSRYALPMAGVAEVGRPPVLTRVPGLPAWVAGVANWRGRVLCVLDLRPLLTPDRPGGDVRHGRLVVLAHGGLRVGLLVESVTGAVSLAPTALEQTLLHLPATSGSLLAGQVTDADGPYGVLDLDAVLGLSSTLPRARRAG